MHIGWVSGVGGYSCRLCPPPRLPPARQATPPFLAALQRTHACTEEPLLDPPVGWAGLSPGLLAALGVCSAGLSPDWGGLVSTGVCMCAGCRESYWRRLNFATVKFGERKKRRKSLSDSQPPPHVVFLFLCRPGVMLRGRSVVRCWAEAGRPHDGGHRGKRQELRE
jgi:hypothetical protein